MLVDRGDETNDGSSWLSIPNLADPLGLRRQSVAERATQLKDAGLLTTGCQRASQARDRG